MAYIIWQLLIVLLKLDVNFFDNGEYRFQHEAGDLIPRTDMIIL